MEICVKLHLHSISYLYSALTDKQTGFKGLAALMSTRWVENAWGLWLKWQTSKRMKKCVTCISPCITELSIQLTCFTEEWNLVTEKRWLAEKIAPPITIFWHDSEVEWLSTVFFFSPSITFWEQHHSVFHEHALQFKTSYASFNWLMANIYYKRKRKKKQIWCNNSFWNLNNNMTAELCWLPQVWVIGWGTQKAGTLWDISWLPP